MSAAEPARPDDLAAEIAAFIARDQDDEATFDTLAQQLFAHQYAANAPYRAFCEGRGQIPETISSWRDIPAAPAAAFKRFALSCAPEEQCVPERGGRVFHSSGTTGAEMSHHFLDARALDRYRMSLRAGFARFVLPDRTDSAAPPIWALMPPPDALPHSSLSFMLGTLIGDFEGRFFHEDDWQTALANALGGLSEPIVLFGTAFAWVHFFDFFDTQAGTFSLPSGSRVVETGGFKGRSREVTRDDLYTRFTTQLGVAADHCLAEYGMSEMASQCYDSTLRDTMRGVHRTPRKIGPPWLRTRIVDPVTGRDAPGETPGVLVHYDLANLNSVCALQTEDYGIAAPDGDGFVLLGRAPGAILRGCSLTAEEFAARASNG